MIVSAPTIDDVDMTAKVALSSNAYVGYAEPTRFQCISDTGQFLPEDTAQLTIERADGGMQCNRIVAAAAPVSDKTYVKPANFAANICEEKLAGYHSRCIKTALALSGATLEGAQVTPWSCMHTAIQHKSFKESLYMHNMQAPPDLQQVNRHVYINCAEIQTKHCTRKIDNFCHGVSSLVSCSNSLLYNNSLGYTITP
jgi:hypothetical protein